MARKARKWGAVDIETATDSLGSVCEIAIVVFDETGEPDLNNTRYTLVRPPDNFYTAETCAIHKISPEDTVDAPEWKDIAASYKSKFKGMPLVAHNAEFEKMHFAAYQQKGLWSPHEELNFCTLRASRYLSPAADKHKLGDVADRFGVSVEGWKRAVAKAKLPEQKVQNVLGRGSADEGSAIKGSQTFVDHHALHDAYLCGAVWTNLCQSIMGKTPWEGFSWFSKLSDEEGSQTWWRQRRPISERQKSYLASLVSRDSALWDEIIMETDGFVDIDGISVELPQGRPPKGENSAQKWAGSLNGAQASYLIDRYAERERATPRQIEYIKSLIPGSDRIEEFQIEEDGEGCWEISAFGCSVSAGTEKPARAKVKTLWAKGLSKPQAGKVLDTLIARKRQEQAA